MADPIKSNPRDAVLEKLVAALEKNDGTWQKTWSVIADNRPHNPISGTNYRGVNLLSLAVNATENNYNDPRWCTYNQAKEAGHPVAAGQKCTAQVLFYKVDTILKNGDKEYTLRGKDLHESAEKLINQMYPTLKVEDGPDMIRSENARLNSYVYVDTKDSDLTGYINKAKVAIAANVKFKPGYSISWAGQYEYMQRAKERLSYSAPFTLLIIGLLLYLCFGRLTEVVIILASLPFSLVGGAWMLYFLGYNMSVAVDVGFIALAGVAAETGVVMLIYLNQSLADKKAEVSLKNVPLTNKDIYDAIVEGSLHRLRPKMMTVCAIIGGLLPILIFAGTGSIVVRHIAAPMVGGMLSSAILTLIVIPCIYLLWAQFKNEKNTK